jgi:hypothetical protein
MERVAGGRVARPQSLASAGAADGDFVCQRSSHGDDVVARRRRQRRLPRLLLLPRRRGTQERIDCDAALGAGAANIVLAGARAVGDRRFAHQAVWPAGRRRRCPSQSDPGPGRSAVFIRTRMGHDFAGPEASAVGPLGIAAASAAVRSPANDGDDPQVAPVGAICNQAPTGGAIGGMGRSNHENSGENGLQRANAYRSCAAVGRRGSVPCPSSSRL